MDLWVKNGWLKPCNKEEKSTEGIVPLMVVEQQNKGKVRPVLDFRELNQYVNLHNATSDACDEKVRKWRTLGDKFTTLDLRCAYMQVHIDLSLWEYQKVIYKEEKYYLTRLGFGLNSSPKIMSSILGSVLNLDVTDTWYRIACDVTNYKGSPYLTMIDCGSSRFAVWRKLPCEDIKSVVSQLESVFRGHGPPQELLMDNGAVFKSKEFSNICEKWCVKKKYRCAYRPSGNGIVERNHRTVKRTAARAQICPLLAVFWYNATPTVGTNEKSAPASQKNMYVWRLFIQEEKNTETTVKHRFWLFFQFRPLSVPLNFYYLW